MTGHAAGSHADPHIGSVPPETRECLGVDLSDTQIADRIRAATAGDTCDLTMDEVAARAAGLPAALGDDDTGGLGDAIVLEDLTDH